MFEEWVMADEKSREATAGAANARIAWEKATADRERAALCPEDYEAAREAHIESVARFNAATAREQSARHLERFQWLRYVNSAHKETIGSLHDIRGAVNQNSRMYTSLLCEIRDLLTKMANPPIMVSLESTPESRAALREAKREAAEPASHIGKVVQQITESTKKAYETCQEAGPVNDGSEAASRAEMLHRARLAASADAGLYLHLLRRVVELTRLTVDRTPAGYPDVADFLRQEAGRT